MRIVVLAGGIGGARFLRGLKAAAPDADITVIGNTGDDIHLFGLKVCPDLDTVMYTLGGGINEDQGWGRTGETFRVKEELAAYGVGPEWFGLGDRDFATHIVRTQMLGAGYPLSAVTEALCDRWQPGVRLLPMSDDRVETHVAIEDETGERKAVHFQEYWVRLRASVPALAVVPVGAEQAKPAPGVLEALAAADVILFPPSNPVVSIGTILAVPGIREAVAEAAAPVVGLSPIVGNAPVRGMADKVLEAVGVESTAAAVAKYYGGAERRPVEGGAGLLDGWLVDEVDADAVADVEAAGIRCRAVPLMMTDVDATAAMARTALALAAEVRK
ncbi:2-phospho-L-lactate transferase [Streptomyces noursei]|uniref:Phosphoenolpyruvate transferase n=1 Tax=Streptomyces noursei TaxID=1971 RepID=A0A059W2J3_STRNR|nr:2-phospho-L-lactate transferase [Streptomyces noursei]AKA04213.1 2-phospho-L-lactate transferase [Streptomyces noursei ZPM]AIA03960.1 2-phopspho-L-lactate transferase [Streptomyces noursei]EOS97178.1 2-phospho-L-lactate transferase [Streptomyces noursei CCRC 11814]EXU89736.1 2-phospho-L-lactate transferase [Streptomyces noursei PD-1]MCZ0975024.1 2-phospho-L-lactate transferase [Streptomyces noursei]